jgi:iron complex outermembrane receptor protein
MTFADVSRSALPFRPHALALSISLSLFAAGAIAQDLPLQTVHITGPRFASDPALTPIGATVITGEDIRRAGANDVNGAIRKIGGVYGRQSLDSSSDFALDLRGFGENGSQNLVVMLDGVRLSENELTGATLSTIPIDTVERIEITRGGSSVLYGEGATGGVINIVTRRAGERGLHGSARGEAGRFGQHDARLSVTQGWDQLALDAALARQGQDGFRANSKFSQSSFSGGAQWRYAGGRLGVRVERASQDSRFPGSLTLDQFNTNPRQTVKPNDFGSLDTRRVVASVEHRIGTTELAAELSHREKDVKASYVNIFDGIESVTKLAYDSRQTQFSPRLRRLSQLDGALNELVAGVDVIHWERKTTSDFSLADASQQSKAIYLRDEVRWNGPHAARLAVGVRRELFDKDYTDPAPFAQPVPSATQGVNAWEVQGSYAVLAGLALHAKAGQSYRIANADENAFRPGPNVLEPQTSHDLELGASFGDAARKVSARVFRHKLDNELFYDPTTGPFGFGANTNLDPTRRQGIEIDAEAALNAAWRVSAHAQHVSAKFREGPNAGREMALVPKNVVSARLAWVPDRTQSADIGVQWVDSQRYGGDFTNSCAARIPSYATVDARYARRIGAWELALSGMNLADRSYFSNAFVSNASPCKAAIYPSDGRQLKVSVRYDF